MYEQFKEICFVGISTATTSTWHPEEQTKQPQRYACNSAEGSRFQKGQGSEDLHIDSGHNVGP